jgi:GNAT superfamily N-acetyltransferase
MSEGDVNVPAGLLRLTITYLEMRQRPSRVPAPAPPLKLALMRAEAPTVSFYRYLYNTVGEPWLWTDRRRIADEPLAAHLRDTRTEIYVLHVAGVPAGFGEIVRETAAETDIAYFGLLPDFIGRRLGPFLLDAIVDIAWSQPIRRLTVNTCTFDHPGALPMYQRAGFTPYRQESVLKEDPRLSGLLPRQAAPHVPLAEATANTN